jgi:uncharacterized protein YhjY with autotransporter beta-barrel domain
MAAATALAVAGIGLSVASFFGGSDAAAKQAQIQKQIFAQQKKIEEQKRLGMELDAQRRTLQQIRNAQQARSLALNAATNQGAAKGSGLEGGYAQIAGYTNTGLLGINQNLDIGRNISTANQAISGLNMQLADAKADSDFWSGLGGLGGKLTGAAGLPMFA